MVWLWYAAPVAIGLIYILTGLWPDRRRSYEVQRWRIGFRGAAPPAKGSRGSKKKKEVIGPPEVSSMPGDLTRMVEEAGGGAVLAYYELFPKLAYLAEMAADATAASDHHTVVAKLAKPGPTFTVRPLPIVEGVRVENTGVKFPKDPEFMQLFLVEGEDARAIGKWLKRSMREALCEYPDLWLHVRGRAMGLTLFGPADAEQIDDLIAVADEIFAEVGAEGAPSLIAEEEDDEDLDDEDEDLDDEDDEDEDEDEEDDDEDLDDEDDEDDEDDDDADAAEEKPQPKAVETKSASAPAKKTAAAKPSGAPQKTPAKPSPEPSKAKAPVGSKSGAKPGSSGTTKPSTK
jgi:hypothetical protein